MSKTRTGKIARLPRSIRNKLNYRLANNEPANELVRWLNELPETKIVLATLFEGREINDQNLADWKAGGHQEWLARQELLAQARELASDAGELAHQTAGALADQLAYVLKLRYMVLLDGWNGEVTDDFERRLRVLGTLNQQIASLRRADHDEERLSLARQKYEQAQGESCSNRMGQVPANDEQFDEFNLPDELKRFTGPKFKLPAEPPKGPRPSRAQHRRQHQTARNRQKPPMANPLSPPHPVTPDQAQSSPIKPSPERGSATRSKPACNRSGRASQGCVSQNSPLPPLSETTPPKT